MAPNSAWVRHDARRTKRTEGRDAVHELKPRLNRLQLWRSSRMGTMQSKPPVLAHYASLVMITTP